MNKHGVRDNSDEGFTGFKGQELSAGSVRIATTSGYESTTRCRCMHRVIQVHRVIPVRRVRSYSISDWMA